MQGNKKVCTGYVADSATLFKARFYLFGSGAYHLDTLLFQERPDTRVHIPGKFTLLIGAVWRSVNRIRAMTRIKTNDICFAHYESSLSVKLTVFSIAKESWNFASDSNSLFHLVKGIVPFTFVCATEQSVTLCIGQPMNVNPKVSHGDADVFLDLRNHSKTTSIL
jgi:hypothetical protein